MSGGCQIEIYEEEMNGKWKKIGKCDKFDFSDES